MEFRLLGPLEVSKDGASVPLGGAKQRALLAILLLHANEVVSRDVLLEELWPDRPSGDSGHSLDVQVSRLRKTLGTGEMLVTRSGGYVLEVEREQIDVRRFERLLEEGRRHNAAGRPAEAAAELREALALWRGGALADLAYEDFARGEIERLDELRLVATEERIDADLALGQHDSLVPELESLAAKHPLRERLRGQLMLALYRSGRQAEALRVYGGARRRLVDELGLEPGQQLQQLEQAILRQDPSLDLVSAAEPVAATHRRRGPVVAAIALVLTAGAAAIGVLLAQGGTQNSPAQSFAEPDSVALVSARTGRVVGQSTVGAPVLTRFGEGSLWSLSATGELTRIDPASGEVIKRIATRIDAPCGLAVGEGAVWVTDCSSPTLLRIDPAQNVVVERFHVPVPYPELVSQTQEVAVGAGSVWVAQGVANPSYVYRLDPRTGRVQARILIPEGGAQALAFGDGALWVANVWIHQVSRIDPRTNEIAATGSVSDAEICCLAAGGGYAWAATTPDREIWKIGENGRLVTSIKVPATVENLTYADGALWAAEGEAGTVVRIDPTTDAQRTYELGHYVLGVAAHQGLVAAGVQESARDVTAGLEGRIVRVALKEDYLDWTSPDPAATQSSFNPYQVQFQYATCAKLFNYPDAAGPAGRRLVPEVAAAFPTLSDGGRTATFRVRPGYRFSPPSNETVTAESFRHEIERFLSPRLNPGPWALEVLADVVGAKAFVAGRAAHVSGVTAQGDRLVIRLVRPAPDLPVRLARPAFCAVPVATPVALHGLPSPIPSAGPYYLVAHGGDAFVLKRNPNYGGSRPQRLDAIVYWTGVDVGDAIARTGTGMVDYVQEGDSGLAPGTAAARTAGSRYRLTPNNWTEGIALNTRRPLFSGARLRRAVAYALDRRTLARTVGLTRPTSDLLPPHFSGSDDMDSYQLGRNLRLARKLAGARRDHAVFAAYADAAGNVYDEAFVESLRAQLGAIGIELTVLPLRQGEDNSADVARADLTRVSTNADQTRDPVRYLGSLPYLPRPDRARLERIARHPYPRRVAEAVKLAATLERDGVYLGFAHRVYPELVSKRLGCVIDQPEYPGLDLAALCLPDRGG